MNRPPHPRLVLRGPRPDGTRTASDPSRKREGLSEGIRGNLGKNKKKAKTTKGLDHTKASGPAGCDDAPTPCVEHDQGKVVEKDKHMRRWNTLRSIRWRKERILSPTACERCRLFVRSANSWKHPIGRTMDGHVSSMSRRGALPSIHTRRDRARESNHGRIPASRFIAHRIFFHATLRHPFPDEPVWFTDFCLMSCVELRRFAWFIVRVVSDG